MDKFYKAKFAFLLILSGLFATAKSYAEGSKDLYPAGAGGGRACLVSSSATKGGWPLTTTGVHYAYVVAGETLAAASSAQGIASGQIIFTAPDGTVYSSTPGTTTVGQIASRAQELAGPWAAGGYTPYTQVVGAGQTGLWKIELLSTSPANNLQEGVGANWQADAAWTQSNASSAICAWDITVRTSGGVIKPGRVYTNVLNMYVQYGDYRGKLWVLTKDGYVFKVNNNGSNGLGFVGFVNNRGLTKSGLDGDQPLYKSVGGTGLGNNVFTWDPRKEDSVVSVTQKMFYQAPDKTMPATAPVAGGKTYWLNPSRVVPTISNIAVDGVEGTSGQVSSKGAYITFNANTTGTYRITLEGTGSFVTRKMTGTALAGPNSVFWDGKDGANVTPSLGTANVTAKVQLQGSEIHFPFLDVEDNPKGLIIEQMANDNVTVESDVVYWADSTFALDGTESNPLINGNEGTGISSNTNGHKWGTNFGNNRTMDTWTYVLGDIASKNTSLNIVRADLAVQGITPAVPGTTQVYVGQTLSYNVTVVNNGPSDVTGAPFAIKVPAGFSIGSTANVTYNTSCGAVNSPNLDASGNYSALLDLPNGCVVTFTFTGTVTATGAINIESSIMRPKDVTDPDATNPNTAVPPTDPHVECKNGGTTETCNNIKYNTSVTALASANVVVTKTTAATSYVPGRTIVYTFTVANNSVTQATGVRVTDNAPAGTTITSWTAAFTTGTGTLPAASGTGNIDQTIATLPGNAVVTYTVTVTIPANFTGNLQNTASASSADDHSPADNTSTTPGIPAAPEADIQVTKFTAYTTFAPGEDVIYSVTVTNNGPSDAANVHVLDNAPANTVVTKWDVTNTIGAVTVPANSGTGNLDQIITNMPNGSSVTYTIRLTTSGTFTGSLTNTASASSPATDNTPANNTVTTPPITANPRADVAITKSTTATSFAPGEDVTYTVVVVNNGTWDAPAVNVIDNAPAGTTIKAWTATATPATITLPAASGSGNINQTIASLPNGGRATYTVTVSTPSSFAGNLSNTASVSTTATDDNTANNTATTSPISPAPRADVAVVASAVGTTYTPGEEITYTIKVTNNGPSDAVNVHLLNDAPVGTVIKEWTATAPGTVTLPASSGIGNIDQIIAALAPGEEVTYTVVVTTYANTTGTLSNTATVTNDVTDNVTTNNTSTSNLTAAPKADIAVVKSTTATTFAPGQDVTYTITVTNNGPSDAANVVVTDNAPTGTTIKSWTAAVTNGTVTLPATSGTGNISQTIANVPDDAVVTYTVILSTSSAFTGNLSNTASGASDATDPVAGNNTSTTPGIPAAPQADIAVVKSTTATDYAPGEDVTYTITVTNNGPSNAANVAVIDNAPTGTTIKSWTAAVTTGTVTLPATSGTGNISQTILNVPNAAVVTYTVTVATPSGLTGNLSNTASGSSATTDPVAGNNISTTPGIPAAPKADIAVVKSTTATDYAPGEDVTYTITVTNNGPSNAANVVVTDNAPTGTTIKSWTAAVTTGTVTLPATSGTGNISQTIANVPNGAVVTYTVTIATPSSLTGNLSNTASGSSDATDPVAGNNSSTTPGIPAAPKADIAVVKSTTANAYAPGEDVTYTITVTNNGPSNAANVVVSDNAPTGTTIKSWTAAVTTGTVTLPATSGTGNISQTIANVPNGAVVTYTVAIATPSSLTGNLSNTASGSSDATDPVAGNNTSTTPGIPAAPKADIAVVKSTTATDYAPGEDVTYTITVTNNGPSNAANVVVTDNAPTGTTIKSWTAAVTTGTVTLPATSGTGNISQTIANVPNGAVVTYTVTVGTSSSLTGNLSNTASGSSDATDPVAGSNTSTTPGIPAAPKADIAVVKSTTATTFAPGEDVTYTITVANNGPSDAANVVVTDNAPTGTTIKSWTAAVTTGSVTLPATSGTGNINQTIGTLRSGALVTYTVTVSTPSSFTGSLSNTASASSDATDNTPANNTSTTPGITPAPKADIAVVKSTTATTFAPGEDVTYTITVTNNGPSDAANVVVTDNAPTGTTIKSWTVAATTGTVTFPATSGSGNLSQTIANVPNGAVVTYTVNLSTPSSFTGNLSNTASGSSDATDPVAGNNTSTTPGIPAAPKADIAVVKSTTATAYAPGEDVTYTITVTNNGPSNAANVVVTDNAPTGTTIKSWTAAVTTGSVTLPAASGTGNINQTIANVPNGAVVTYTVTVATPSSLTGNLSNTAAGSSDATDPVAGNNTSTTPGIPAAPKADIAVVKSTTATTFAPGEDVTYTITVANNGPSDAANVVVTDNAPTGTTIKSWSVAVTTGSVTLPATSGTGNIHQTIGTLRSGALVTYTVTVSTPSSFTGSLSNTASASSDATDNTPANNSSTTPGITPAPKADIAVVKSTTATTFAPGEDVTYTITVTNNGPSNAANVKVIDNAPTGTTIKSWSAAVTTGTVTLPATSGSGNLSQTIANVPNGAVVTYTVTVATPSSFTGNLSNTASASSDAIDNTPANNSSSTPGITPAPKANITVAKSTTATTFAPGENVTYTFTVTNNGPSDAANVKVIDNAPTGTSIQSWSAAVTTGTVTLPATSGNGNINQTITKVPNGAVVTYTVTVATPSSFTGNLSNTASASSDATDNTPGDNSSTTPGIPAAPKADIGVVKATTATTYVPGKDVVYTIKVTNNGPSDAAAVNVKDVAPAGTAISVWTASVTNGTVTLPHTNGTGNLNETIAKMPNGAIVTYTVTLHVNANVTGNLSNTASATTTATDNVPANNSSTTPPITETRQVDLVVVKATTDAAQANYTPGTAIDYTITVTNNGPSDAQNVTVKDVAPAGTTIRSWTATVVSGNATPSHMSGAFGLDEVINTMATGSVVKYDLKLETPSSFKGSVSNTAVVGSDVADTNPADNTSTTKSLIPVIKADLEVTKTLKDAAQKTFKPGDQVFYYITIKNNGPSDASNVNVKDVAPAGTNIFYWGVNILNGTVTLPNRNGNTDINETIAALPAGAVIRYEVGVLVHADHTGNLTNTATATSTTPDADTDNNTSTSPALTDAAKADVAIAKKLKDATQTSAIAGRPLEYVITVTNNGPDAAALVAVKDVAPAGTTIGAWTATVTNGTADLKDASGTGDLNAVITSLSSGAVVTYNVTVLLPDNYSAANISNTATANSQTADPVTTNNSITTPALPVNAAADLQIAKATAEQSYVPGRTIVYTIDVTNAGPSAAKSVNIKDIAPAGTTISAWTATVTNGTVILPKITGTGDLNETITAMSANTAVQYSVTVSVPVDFRGDISNTATVSSTTTDKDQTNNTSTTTALKPVQAADLEVTKQLKDPSQKNFVAGKDVVYIITVKNNGPAPATKVNIKDLAPAGTTITTWTATVTSGTVTLPNANGTGDLNETIALMPDQSVVTYEVVVKTPETFQGTLVNTVDVSSETSDPAPTCAACTAPAVAAEALPEADQDDYGNVRADNPVTIPVLKNDKPGNVATPLDPKSVEIVQQPAHGTIIINEDGTVVYTPAQGYTGPDSFTYRVQDEHGSWSNVATVNMNIVPDEVTVPNVITPNGDGSNDKLVITGLNKFVQNEIVIYNRWNNVLYRKQNYQGEWDGQGLNAGTYYYTLKGLDANGQWHTYNGYIMLLR